MLKKRDAQKATQLKNEINHLKRRLKKNYYTDKIEEIDGDTKKLWKVLKEMTGNNSSKESVEPELLTKEKANKHNKYFATVGAEIQKKLKIQPHTTNFSGIQGFNFKDETIENIEKLIDKIKKRCSCRM